MSEKPKYPWPAYPDWEMPMEVIKAYSARGLRYADLFEPKCWDCGAKTEAIDPPTPALPLKFNPHCKLCSDAEWTRSIKALDDNLDRITRESSLPAAVTQASELQAMVIDPDALSESDRALAQDLLEQIEDSIAEMKNNLDMV